MLSYLNKNSLLVLAGIATFAILLRYVNVSPFKIYPDFYFSLLIAGNISNYFSVTGFLGNDGMFYPPFLMWTRTGFPLLILIVNFLTNNLENSARIAAFAAGIAAIPLSYLFLRDCFPRFNRGRNDVKRDSKIFGLSGALLLALSFNHIVWGGLGISETAGVMFLMIFLYFLFVHCHSGLLPAKPSYAWQAGDPESKTHTSLRTALGGEAISYKKIYIPVFMGIAFTLAVITRYEYVLLLLPVLLYLVFKKTHFSQVSLFISTFLLSALIILLFLFPISGLYEAINIQLTETIGKAFTVLVSLGIMAAILYKLKSSVRDKLLERFNLFFWITLVVLTTAMAIVSIFPSYLPSVSYHFGGLFDFMKNDYLLWGFFLIGFFLMFRAKSMNILLIFISASIVILFLIYHQTNPLMERYMTHLIPFLLIPAGYGMIKLVELIYKTKSGKIKFTLVFFITAGIFYQTLLSFYGIKGWAGGSYFETSYEEEAAKQVMKLAPDKSFLLIASFPEPYYFFTGMSTHSIADTPPFIYIDDSLNAREVLLIQDEGMRDIFPEFSNFLDQKLQDYKYKELSIDRMYHYAQRTQSVGEPVVVYKLKLERLKKIIDDLKT